MASLIIYKVNVWCAIVFYMFLSKLATAYIQRNSYNVEKRMDIETCEGRFNIQREMIIKTEESRKLGAKYLDYADVGSREECLRLCCETIDCDVFVFEEKAIGSCFLFHCGPAQNFRCKFVEHANYTSAVLTTPVKKIQQQQPPQLSPGMYQMQLPTPASLSQHELELSNLKGKSLRADGQTAAKVSSLNAPLSDTSTTRVGGEVINNSRMDKTGTLCGRYQFACHSGECIAIYNACDGIPQCFDGSDEGPGCPTTASPLLKNSMLKQKDGRVALHKTNSVVQSTMQKQLQSDRFYNSVTRNREDPMTAPQWIAPQQMDNNQQAYLDSSSHIFNHKGGIQISNNNNQQQIYAQKPGYNMDMANGYVETAPREPYMPMQGYQVPQWNPDQGMNGNWPQQLPQFPNKPIVVAPHQEIQMDHSQGQMMVDPQVQQDMLNQNWPVRPLLPVNVPMKQESNALTPNNVKQPEEKPKLIENSNNDDPKSKTNEQEYSESAENKETDYENEEKPTEKPKKKSRKHKKLENNSKKSKDGLKKDDNYDDNSFSSDVSIEFIDHDGLAERPGGAVLSLTLGVIVMAALAIVIGCRANVARRRGRRGGKNTYAHDADFLVNGMYL